jgi:hypothetical protein
LQTVITVVGIVLQLIIGVATVIASLFITKRYGDLAGAQFQQKRADKEMQHVEKRITITLMLDIRLIRRLLRHNAGSAANADQERPRAFIRLPIEDYRRLLFSGTYAHFQTGPVPMAVTNYLSQAYHVNAMIGLYEQIETQNSGQGARSGSTGTVQEGMLFYKKREYVTEIGRYCATEIPGLLDELETAIDNAVGIPYEQWKHSPVGYPESWFRPDTNNAARSRPEQGNSGREQ